MSQLQVLGKSTAKERGENQVNTLIMGEITEIILSITEQQLASPLACSEYLTAVSAMFCLLDASCA